MNKYLIYALCVALSWGGYQAYMRQKEAKENEEFIKNIYIQNAKNNAAQKQTALQQISEMNNDKTCQTIRTAKLDDCIRMRIAKLYPIRK